MRKPQILLLSLAVTAALAACSKKEEAAAPATVATAASAEPAKLTLDESKLPPVNRFLLTDLDTTKNACTDFGGYVNGKWLAANDIPSDRTSWGAFEMLDERSTAVQKQLAEQAAAHPGATGVEKIVGDLWATGMDEAKANAQGIEPIAPMLKAIDGLQDKDAIVAYLNQSAAKGQAFLFGFGAEADFNKPDTNMAYAFQGGLGLPDKNFYFDADKKNIRDEYVKHIAKVLELSGVAAADAQKQASDIMAFETRLAKVSKSNEEMSRDVSLYYNPVTLADADKLTPNFSWTKFFESQGVAPQEKFSLAVPAFHQEVSKMLGDTDPAAWRAYLRFHTIDGASPYLSDAFANENFNFYAKTLRGQKEIEPRWKRVLSTIEGQSGEALGQMYVKVAFSPEAKAKMETLVANLGTALKARIQNLTWMSDETKSKAMEKQAAFTTKIGYPDKWRDWTGLSTSRDSYIGNVLAAMEFNYKWNLGKIGKPVDRTEWGMPPQMVNAYYNPLQNEIVFPAAIMQPPFFDPAMDDAVNYGAMGSVIGHELMHGFDDQGSKFDARGNYESWWGEQDRERFEARAGQLVEQFNRYVAVDGLRVNGELTLGENIADLGGLLVAHDAFRTTRQAREGRPIDGLTPDQRFFLAYAQSWRRSYRPEALKLQVNTDPHSPANFRVIGPLSNMDSFARAFGCKDGDAMVSPVATRVGIW